jgi:hypothetical protein
LPKLTRAADDRRCHSPGRGILPGGRRTPQHHIASLFRNLRTSPPSIDEADRAEPAGADPPDVGDPDQNTVVNLGRLAWLGTVGACLIAVLILVLEGYYGYAAVTFAVAVAAFINLL